MQDTKIEWADYTFNPWVGCTKISPACDHCYAESWAKRAGRDVWGPGKPRQRTSEANWKQPIKWNEQARIAQDAWDGFKAANPGLSDGQLIERGFIKPRRPRVFCASLADVFDNAVPPEWRTDLFRLIQATPHLDWLLLTKRIGNAHQMIGEALIGLSEQRGGAPTDLLPTWPWKNVWLGATICNQEEADRDIPKLLTTSAAKRFINLGPLLEHVIVFSIDGPVDVPSGTKSPIDWVMVEGESGPHARPMHPYWLRDMLWQCEGVGVPLFFKQWGEWFPRS